MQQQPYLPPHRGEYLYAVAIALIATIAACGHAAPTPAPAVAKPIATPTTITGIARPNGLVWDAARARLLVADDATLAIVPWTDAGAGAPIAIVSAPVEKDGLGGVALAPDGGAVVAHFGGGSAGGLVRVGADGKVAAIAGLDPARRRLGVAVAGDGAIIVAWFVKAKDQPKRAGLERIDPSTGAVGDLVTGLDKPVGVLVDGDALWFSDQGAGTLSRCTLPACGDPKVIAHVDGPDLLGAGRDHTVLVASGHDLVAIAADGKTTALAHDLDRPRGIAIDPAGRRLFVADRAAVRIIPWPLP